MNRQVRFTVSMEPHPKRRPVTGRTKRGKTVIYTDAKTLNWERTFCLMAAKHSPETPFEGACGIDLVFMLRRPGRLNRRSVDPGEAWHSVRPDLDNLVKSALDALQLSGRFFRDDSQISVLNCRKYYHAKDMRPEVSVKIYELECG
tara:strand:+ start:65 stop:502 length:438 start_codon:yes stop_codon:yes gene_type:complete